MFFSAGLCVTGCGTDECDDGSFQCAEAEMLQACVDGAWEDAEDCMAMNMMCHAEMGHCMSDDEDMDM